jgi:hypothetical protein
MVEERRQTEPSGELNQDEMTGSDLVVSTFLPLFILRNLRYHCAAILPTIKQK